MFDTHCVSPRISFQTQATRACGFSCVLHGLFEVSGAVGCCVQMTSSPATVCSSSRPMANLGFLLKTFRSPRTTCFRAGLQQIQLGCRCSQVSTHLSMLLARVLIPMLLREHVALSVLGERGCANPNRAVTKKNTPVRGSNFQINARTDESSDSENNAVLEVDQQEVGRRAKAFSGTESVSATPIMTCEAHLKDVLAWCRTRQLCKYWCFLRHDVGESGH